MTAGIHGQFKSEKVLEVSRKIIKTALKYDKHPRMELSGPTVAKQIEEYKTMGVTDFCIETDLGILERWIKSNGHAARRILGN
jgi:hypothetical protein